jgi:glycosyltransferase involved in cell wall biosynthesis
MLEIVIDKSRSENFPEVSVIVPNYNHAQYLDLRLQSIFNQTYTNFELIFLDDASTDKSLDVFKKYVNDSRVRCIINEKNSGSAFKQWNKGASLAHGKYLWIAESDDFAEPDFLEKTIPIMEENPNLGLVYTQSIMIDKDGKEFGLAYEEIWRSDPRRWMSSFTNDGMNEIKNYLCFENTIPNASATLIRKTVFEKVGGAKESLKLHGDYVLWLDILCNSDIAFIPNPLNHFRFSPGSIREKLFGGGFDIEERYQITKYMFDIVHLDPEIQERICYDLVRAWIHPNRIRIPLSRQKIIAKAASVIDRKLYFNIWKRLITGPFKLLYMEIYLKKKRKEMLYLSYHQTESKKIICNIH